ncbi:MAG: hypothetical protein AAFY26_19185 [Cyanobacteria bacterium J06638_22]
MTQETYNTKFDVGNPKSDKLRSAFAQVSDTRKFEIELYWKRAAYFWTLIAVAFAGYFSILAATNIDNRFFLALIVGLIGLVFTFAWYLANRGSKYWQENWENHLDMLEDDITGPLYKTLLERPGYRSLSERFVTGPLSVSVSRINQWVSTFVLFVWLCLVAFACWKSLGAADLFSSAWVRWTAHTVVLLAALFCCFMMFFRGRTHKGDHAPRVRDRVTRISDELE